MPVLIKRIYDEPSKEDGYRVLVDRLWPRGVSKERAALGEWLKDIAPSNELRTWFGHKPERYNEFFTRYTVELDKNPATPHTRELIKTHPTVTLLYSAHDTDFNQAQVLRKYLS